MTPHPTSCFEATREQVGQAFWFVCCCFGSALQGKGLMSTFFYDPSLAPMPPSLREESLRSTPSVAMATKVPAVCAPSDASAPTTGAMPVDFSWLRMNAAQPTSQRPTAVPTLHGLAGITIDSNAEPFSDPNVSQRLPDSLMSQSAPQIPTEMGVFVAAAAEAMASMASLDELVSPCMAAPSRMRSCPRRAGALDFEQIVHRVSSCGDARWGREPCCMRIVTLWAWMSLLNRPVVRYSVRLGCHYCGYSFSFLSVVILS